MFQEKEKEDRRRLLMMQPKRASGRLEYKRKEQEEKDRELAMQVCSKIFYRNRFIETGRPIHDVVRLLSKGDLTIFVGLSNNK